MEKKEYLNGIRLDIDDLVIDGNGHSIHASNAARIFYCTGKNVTLKNYLIKDFFQNIKNTYGSLKKNLKETK